jgi:hypothetical protein
MTSTTSLIQQNKGSFSSQNNTPPIEVMLVLSINYTIKDLNLINPKPLLEVLKQCLK